MGFWGTYIVARAQDSLTEMSALRASVGDVVWHGRGPGGWQVVQVHRGPDGWASREVPAPLEATLRALMEQADGPVLAAAVLDSDGAQLIGYSPREGRWGGWLMLERIIEHIDPDASVETWFDDDDNLCEEDDATYLPRYQAIWDRISAKLGAPGPSATPEAVAWAVEAGLKPDAAAIATVLDTGDVFCEDHFFALLGALGVPALAPVDA